MLLLSAERTRALVWWERHLTNGGSEWAFKGPLIPFGSMVEYHPISAKDLSRLHKFDPKSLTRNIPSVMKFSREESGKETFFCRRQRNWEGWMHQKSMPGDSMETPHNWDFFYIPHHRWNSSKSGGDQVLRTSTLIQDPQAEEKNKDIF